MNVIGAKVIVISRLVRTIVFALSLVVIGFGSFIGFFCGLFMQFWLRPFSFANLLKKISRKKKFYKL